MSAHVTSRLGTHRNGVDVDGLGELVQSVRDDPRNGQTTWHAAVEWEDGLRSRAQVRSFPPVTSDEPEGFGGGDTAPNPFEQLLAALGNCLAVGYAANASVAGITLDAVRVEVFGELDISAFCGLSDGNPGFDTITAVVHITSSAPPELLQELHCSVTRTSVVGSTISRAVPLTVTLAP